MSANRMLLVLDIDANLVSVQKKPTDEHCLLQDALGDLSGPDGQVHNPNLIKERPTGTVTAFRQGDWKALFQKIVAVNQAYRYRHRSDAMPLISIIFLTNARYDGKQFIENVFEAFFTKEITDTLLPDYKNNISRFFFNRDDQQRLVNAHYMENGAYKESFLYDTYDTAELTRARNQLTADQFTQFVTNMMFSVMKGLFLELKFEELKTNFGIVKKSDIILADDSIDNITSATNRGFLAAHNPSTDLGKTYRTYTEGRVTFFNTLREYINKPNNTHHLYVVTPTSSPKRQPKKRQRDTETPLPTSQTASHPSNLFHDKKELKARKINPISPISTPSSNP